MNKAYWTVAHDGNVLIAEYWNPPANYFVDAAVTELAEIFRGLRARTDVRAVVLTGRPGQPFITHFEVEEILAGVLKPEEVVLRGPVRNTAVGELFAGMATLPVPVIVAMSGDTMGFGFELALACDIRIGQRGDILYGLPEVRLGIIPGSGGTQRLARLVGLDRAFDIVIRGRVFDPEVAHEAGLITELADDARARALVLAHEIASFPQLAIAVAKRALNQGIDAPLAAGLAIESDASVRAKLGPEVAGTLGEYLALAPAARREWLRGA